MIERRSFLTGLGALALQGCTQISPASRAPQALIAHYAATTDGGHPVSEVRTDWIEEDLLRTEIPNTSGQAPGSIRVDSASKHLFFARSEETVLRYGVALGSEAHGWSGAGYVNHIRAWPVWTPTARMIAEQPGLASYRGGMPGGPGNPLGARALYIYRGGRDTLYRIHGTHATWRIGQNYSAGCIRMFNQDVIELAGLVQPGADILVT